MSPPHGTLLFLPFFQQRLDLPHFWRFRDSHTFLRHSIKAQQTQFNTYLCSDTDAALTLTFVPLDTTPLALSKFLVPPPTAIIWQNPSRRYCYPKVVLPWCPFGGWEYSREEDSTRLARSSSSASRGGERDAGVSPSCGAEGWDNFAVAQKGRVWMEGYVQGNQAVRRRLWRRVYLEPPSVSHTAAAAAVPPPA